MEAVAASSVEDLYQAAMLLKQEGRSLGEISRAITNQARQAGLRTGNLESATTLEITFLEQKRKIFYDGINWHLVPVE